tara:strand:- start:297 stop:473 length:177 start_codon:yes stop_codon:yes gene_type:complete
MNTDPKELKVELNPDSIRKVMKDYKKLKKYMKSSIFEIKKMDGNEKVITKLMKELDKK